MAAPRDDPAVKADFTDRQFAKNEVATAVVAQYDDAKTRLFYQIVMGMRLLPKPGGRCFEASQPSPPAPRGRRPRRRAPQIAGLSCRGGLAGGGGHDIHYGIFRSPADGVRESSAASTAFMMSCMDWVRPVRPPRALPPPAAP